MESDDEDIDIGDLDIEDEPLSSSQSNAPPQVISGLSMVFKAKRPEPESRQAAAVSSLQETTSSTDGQRSDRAGTDHDTFRISKHPKRKSDEAYTVSPSAASSLHMSRHGRSSSSSSSNSETHRERAHSYLLAEERWPSSFSPTQRPIYMQGTSPLGTSPSIDSHLSRRRSLGQPPGVSSYSPGSSPTYSSFAAYHARASTAPPAMGSQSPAFGASSPPNLPLHAHLHYGVGPSTEEVIAQLSHSPHAHVETPSCPPPDADEPWIDLPPSVDASVQSPSREHPSMQWGVSRSPVAVPADVNLERRRSDPSSATRSPAARSARKANSSPARAPIRLSLSQAGQPTLQTEESRRHPISPASLHQRGSSDPTRSPHRQPMQTDQSQTGDFLRQHVPNDLDLGLALSRHAGLTPSGAALPLSTSPVDIASTTKAPSPLPGFASEHEDRTQSPIEMDLSSAGQSMTHHESESSRQAKSDFFECNLKLFPPAPNHDLSMPPRSGWDLSDDADVSPLEEKSLEEAQESFDMDHDLSQEHDQDSAELRPDRSPSSPTIGTIPLPHLDAGEQDKSPEWGAPLDFNRGPVVELETLSPEDNFDADPEGNDGFHIDMDEEGLTPLERIFLFAKSEYADHRETVSRMLPVWIEEVEVCEAVDSILPLFQGLIQDEDFVKEAFASSLDKLMWYFFSHCPLVELSAQHEIIKMTIDAAQEDRLDGQLRKAYKEGLSPNIAVSAGGLQLFKSAENEQRGNSMESIRHAFQEGTVYGSGDTPVSGSTLVEMDSGNTLLGEDHGDGVEVADRPLLPLDTFHGILAALLMNEVSTVSAVAQEALVRFVQFLQDDSLKTPDSPPSSGGMVETPRLEDEVKRPHVHRHYDMPKRARDLIRDDVIDEIVLALFRMQERPAAFASLFKDQSSHSREITSPGEDPSSKFSHFFDDPMASTSPTSADEPDLQQGVFVGLTLVAMLAETNCLSVEYVETRLLPAVVRCAQDPLIVLKKQAAEVLASMSRTVTELVVTKSIAPLISDLSKDPSPTIRRTVASLLPEVVKKIIPEDQRRSYAISISDTLATDANNLVRQAYLEVSGPLIYVFEGNVPEELITHFIGSAEFGSSADVAEEKSSTAFAPLIPAFAVAQSPDPAKHASNDGLGWDVRDDHGRAIITAYNLPGVVLSIGEAGWPKLKKLHAALALDSTISQPRYLTASSIHDIASFIGKEQAAADLLPVYKRLAADDDIEVVMRAFERFAEFLDSLPSTSTPDMAQILLLAWSDKGRDDWRLREVLAEGLVAVAARLTEILQIDGLLVALKEALYDRITAVRIWAAKSVHFFLENVPKMSFYYHEVSTILYSLATQSHHKHRATYCLCLLEVLKADGQVPLEHWDELANLAEDHVVDVRLVAARCLARIFARDQELVQIPPSAIVRAARATKSDPSASVREELRNINIELVDRLVESGTPTRYQSSSDSSDDEDTHSSSPRSRHPHTKMATLMGSTPSDQKEAEGDAQSSTGVSDNQGKEASGYPTGSDANHEQSALEEEDDDSDDDNDSLDLDSSTIYDIDLDDLAFSSTHLSPKASASLRTPNSRETPPLRHQSSGVLTPSRLSSTPPSRPCQIEKASSSSPWHFSMRDEEQYVAIDITGHA